ncbi:uncharacterized protein LOC108741097 [Agrilus planipennis]|uniref:Uncharacterized protein LOC108741097 n=1 Tax=Agrilus planipennis TaxID=224129 RepID=A0A1W4X543_AGRPL|nr:uncharacterized protein LOC108741097 [Agrilus planipennis]
MKHSTQLVFSLIISSALAATTSYQNVKFLPLPASNTKTLNNGLARRARSYHLPYTPLYSETFWPPTLANHDEGDLILDLPTLYAENLDSIYQPSIDLSLVNVNDYSDPYLLVGHNAVVAVHRLYSKELFFGNYPHVKALLNNNQFRLANGLGENRLGSLRETSPWSRYKNVAFPSHLFG